MLVYPMLPVMQTWNGKVDKLPVLLPFLQI